MDKESILNQIKIEKDLCEYWDVRIEESHQSELKYEDFELIGCSIKPKLGAFIRVYQNGMWYYTSTTDLQQINNQIVALSKQACKYSQTGGTSRFKPYNSIPLHKNLIQFDKVRFDKVSVSEKKKICESYFKDIQAFSQLKGIRVNYVDEYKVKFFRSSTNIDYTYDFNQCGLSVSYSVVDGNGRFDDKVLFYGAKIQDLNNLTSQLTQMIEESHLFTGAKSIEPGEYPVVMNSDVVGVFAHESFGHKSEADFMLGDDEAKETWKIGKKVGNECLSIVDFGGEIGTSGYCPIDDEGFPAQKTYLIKNGLLAGRLHSQFTAQVLDEAPTGNGRSMSFEFEPIVRMTNTYVEPGPLTFEELISKVSFGVFVNDFKHGSGLSTFTIAPRKCYMIREGRIAEPIRVSVISGSVFETLNRIEGCSQDFKLLNSAFGGCGKMEQWPLPVGLGGSNVLVSKMILS